MYCRHREGRSLLHTNVAMSSPQKCLLHTDWETLSVAGQACSAGLENSVVSEVCVHIYACVDNDMYVSVCVCVGGGGGGEQNSRRIKTNDG